ncbi:MAG: hypothetical protein JWP36_2344 [Paucimonas sp.]|jgi:hypothetical protein|nr:hypothetical protein [Paucimonas sp.]
MNWITQAISGFGSSLGLSRLALREDGALRLHTDSGGAIEIHHLADGANPQVLLVMSEPGEYSLAPRLRAALAQADFRRSQGQQLHVASVDGQLVLATRLAERECSQPAVEAGINQLQQLHERIRNNY